MLCTPYACKCSYAYMNLRSTLFTDRFFFHGFHLASSMILRYMYRQKRHKAQRRLSANIPVFRYNSPSSFGDILRTLAGQMGPAFGNKGLMRQVM